MAPRGGRRDVLDADISFDMERLFDPYNFDHIPKENRLDLFKQRNLPHVKHYKAAVKIFGGPHCRTRVIIAPPMETPLKHRLGIYHNVFVPPAPPVVNGALKLPPEPVKELSKEEKAQAEETEKVSNYKSWVAKRKKLRGDLDNLGLNEDFLARKPDKSELEKRVHAKYKADRLWKPESPPPPEVTPSPKPLPDIPAVAVPPPDGLQILDKFLSLNRMRLMDLFLIADKDKSWTLSREEIFNAVTKAAIPLTESEVDDMIITLDADLDDQLNYQEINKGLMQWRKHRRDLKKQGPEQLQQPQEKTSPVTSVNTKGTSGQEKSCTTQEEKSSRPQSKEDERGTKHSRPTSKEQSRETKSPHQERTKEKLTPAERSVKSTPMPAPGERISRESNMKSLSRTTFSRERPESDREVGQSVELSQMREKSDLDGSKKSFREAEVKTAQESSVAMTNVEASLSPSQQRVQTSEVVSSNVLFSRENESVDKMASETLPLDSQMDRSLYEDVLFQSEDTPRATVTAQDIGEEEERGEASESQGQKTSANGTRPGSHRTNSGSHSRTSTPNSLEPPEPDLRQEARAPESLEAMVDIRKHDRVVLSRNNIRRSLSREKRITFDELPGVIKVGYKPIDDHCSESTLGGENSDMVNQFRRDKLKEYFEVRKLFEERGVPFNQRTLDRVLLYPGDKPSNALRKGITLPLGPLTDEFSPFNQPKPKKRSKKRRRGMGRLSRASGMSGTSGGNAASGAGGGSGGGAGGGGGGDSGARNGFGMRRGRADQDDERSGSGSSKRSFLTVEDVYPFATNVTPKVYKENLSSGRALITRKVDNWMTFEEYNKYTQNLPNRFKNINRKSNPDAVWAGHLLDKVRLYMDHEVPFRDGQGRLLENRDSRAYEGYGTGMYNGKGHALFRSTAQPKRAYPGYNNDLLTWPVGENGVRYANIDEHRIVK